MTTITKKPRTRAYLRLRPQLVERLKAEANSRNTSFNSYVESLLFDAVSQDLAIDYSDPWLYEDHGDLPPLPAGKETFTPEEVLDIIMKDVRHIYETEDAVCV